MVEKYRKVCHIVSNITVEHSTSELHFQKGISNETIWNKIYFYKHAHIYTPTFV